MTKCVHFFRIQILLFAVFESPILAQDKPFPFQARNAIYLELGGSNPLYSLNYDRIIATSPKLNWLFGYRAGGSLAGVKLMQSRVVGQLYALLGQRKNHLELGLSSSVGRNYDTNYPGAGSANIFVSPVIAYRLQEPRGPSCFRVIVNPFIVLNSQENSRSRGVFFGISFGRSF
ncbi:hypothetical protein IC229_26665 [Spirosoma sp. BT702]|uniref:Uncharacterized protein n=1 Tax=Spirosoma profusum TaxID=2771354 RepID=A0A926Y563_9BACT|nr:hypothetical protein [Spirosoma profusum]MBD2704255.1 hypothetical protein [Spirosoma profusum]